MYQPAHQLIWQGRLVEGLQLAEEIRVRNYGSAEDVRFRVVTTTETVATLGDLAAVLE